MRSLVLLALALAAPASAHLVPDMFVSGHKLVEQFDPTTKPKMLRSEDGTFVANLPADGWATDAERIRHIRSIDAENGRWYIHAVFDVGRGKTFCFSDNGRPNDETFYEETIRNLRAIPLAKLQRQSAANLLTEIWRARWPCLSESRSAK